MNTNPRVERQFLEEGAASYVDAVNAILAFREIVVTRSGQVVKDRLAEYGSVLGIELEESQIVDWKTPEGKWDGSAAALGTKIKGGGVELCHGLYWGRVEGKTHTIEVATSVWLPRKKVGLLWEKFSPPPPNLTKWEEEIWLSEVLGPGEMGNFEKRLDNLLDQWIRLWKKAGGLKAISFE